MNDKAGNTLQQQYEYYTNLLAQHEKSKRNSTSSCHSVNIKNATLKSTRSIGSSSQLHVNTAHCSNFQSGQTLFSKNKNCRKIVNNPTLQSAKKMNLLNASYQLPKENYLQNKAINYKLIRKGPRSPKDVKVLNNIISATKSNRALENASRVSAVKSDTKGISEKTNSQKLIGEVLAITQQLKLKSNTLSLSNKVTNPCSASFAAKRAVNTHNTKSSFHLKNSKIPPKIGLTINNKQGSKKGLESFQTNVYLCKKEVSSLYNSTDCKGDVSKKNYINPRAVTIKQMHSDMVKDLNVLKKALEKKVSSKSGTNQMLNDCKDPKGTSPSTNITTLKQQNLITTNTVSSDKKALNNLNVNLIRKSITNPGIENKMHASSIKTNKSCTALKVMFHNKSVSNISKSLNSKYKVINKVQLPKKPQFKSPANKAMKKHKSPSSLKKKNVSMFKLVNDKRNSAQLPKCSPSRLSRFRKVTAPASRTLRTKVNRSQKNSRSNVWLPPSKYRLTRPSNKCPSSLVKNVSFGSSSRLDTDIDPDLLLELAAENNLSLLKPKRVYKSKSAIINKHSMQVRTAKMIKSKYLNSNRRTYDWRSVNAFKSFKGYSRNFSSKHQRKVIRNPNISVTVFKNRYQSSRMCTQKKKIINRDGHKFVIGSSGKSLKKVKDAPSYKKIGKMVYKKSPFKTVKTSTPVTKRIASRALNRSINQALSASMKKKTNKVNKYCMFYNRFGRCNKGVKCPYVHDPCKIAVCTRFLRGTCKNEKCLFSHEVNPGKMAICSFFLQGNCTKSDCPYRHEMLSPDAEPCKAFVQGYCSQGKECKKAHVLICPKYLQGICDKGKDCTFPHPTVKEKKSVTNVIETKKIEAQVEESTNRYFQSHLQENQAKGSVVPQRKNLSEQPSFISLTMDNS